MLIKKFFGTDGIRGETNKYPITAGTALKLGKSIGYLLKIKELNDKSKISVAIGRDTRLSGCYLNKAISAGLQSLGIDTYNLGVLPTAGITFMIKKIKTNAGIVVSASHNPFQYNGFKIFNGNGFKINNKEELLIEKLTQINDKKIDNFIAKSGTIGKSFKIKEPGDIYKAYLKSTLSNNGALSGLKIAIDCANGAAHKIAPLVFRELGAKIFTTGANPNGLNINKKTGSLFLEKIKHLVKKSNADLGVALDGDADRVVIVDEKCEPLDGDAILAILACNLKEMGELKENTIAATALSNLGLDECLRKNDIRVIRTNVGDACVVSCLKKKNLNLGGEQSGHIIMLDHFTTGDGIAASLRIAKIILKKKKPLSEIKKIFNPVPQRLYNFDVPRKIPLKFLLTFQKVKNEIEKNISKKSRIMVRYSGTENKARVLMEGSEFSNFKTVYEKIASSILEDIKKYN